MSLGDQFLDRTGFLRHVEQQGKRVRARGVDYRRAPVRPD
jgi:hypothetical protein